MNGVPIGRATSPRNVKLNPQVVGIARELNNNNILSRMKRVIVMNTQTIAEGRDNFGGFSSLNKQVQLQEK
jgi:hypothetical protein